MKRLIYIAIISILLLTISSCQKSEPISGENEQLIGEWKWIYTNNADYCSSGGVNFNKLNPGNSNTYKIEFLKKGKVILYENDKKIDKANITFKESHTNFNTNDLHFKIYYGPQSINNTSRLDGVLKQPDTLLVYSFYPFIDDGCVYKNNYFVKE